MSTRNRPRRALVRGSLLSAGFLSLLLGYCCIHNEPIVRFSLQIQAAGVCASCRDAPVVALFPDGTGATIQAKYVEPELEGPVLHEDQRHVSSEAYHTFCSDLDRAVRAQYMVSSDCDAGKADCDAGKADWDATGNYYSYDIVTQHGTEFKHDGAITSLSALATVTALTHQELIVDELLRLCGSRASTFKPAPHQLAWWQQSVVNTFLPLPFAAQLTVVPSDPSK
jgi:hypothetical protein